MSLSYIQPMGMVLPGVVGFKLTGKLRDGVTTTDLVLTMTEMLRKHGAIGKFVEFYGKNSTGECYTICLWHNLLAYVSTLFPFLCSIQVLVWASCLCLPEPQSPTCLQTMELLWASSL